mmetsp:Transcript_42255/g.133273  ORF Transcript_42255/g.133273 Transcript_42255/m.133273 type:complete len:103 (+) Transcript_42255:1162-1470(+)
MPHRRISLTFEETYQRAALEKILEKTAAFVDSLLGWQRRVMHATDVNAFLLPVAVICRVWRKARNVALVSSATMASLEAATNGLRGVAGPSDVPVGYTQRKK